MFSLSATACLAACGSLGPLLAEFTRRILIPLAILLSISAGNTGLFAKDRGGPNLLLIVADDLGYAELGCQGNLAVQTPRIDQLAQQGIRCTQAYVTAPNCSPSRAAFLTGRFGLRFGYEFNPIGARNEDPHRGLPPSEQTLAEYLHDAGYTTGLVGKWHLGGAADFHPQRHGFDEFYGFLHEGHYFVPSPWEGTTTWIRRKGLPGGQQGRYPINERLIYTSHMGHDEPDYDANNPIVRNGQPVEESAYLTDAITREATSFVERYQGHPWFLYVSYNAVHSPLQAKNETLERFADVQDIQRRIFLAMLYDLDQSVGKILDAVERTSQADNTLVVFFSDNGGPTRETTASNLPLRDGKGSMYEGGIRVPFLARFPGKLPIGETSEAVVCATDVFATMVDLVGNKPAKQLDGINLLDQLDPGQTPQHRTLYWRQGPRAALLNGRWKVVAPQGFDKPGDWELYDVVNDPSESVNLAGEAEHAELHSRLVQQWHALNQQMAEPQR